MVSSSISSSTLVTIITFKCGIIPCEKAYYLFPSNLCKVILGKEFLLYVEDLNIRHPANFTPR